MNNEVIGVFILETEGYVEISYCEFLNRCSTDETYRSKHFIYVSKRLLEVFLHLKGRASTVHQ